MWFQNLCARHCEKWLCVKSNKEERYRLSRKYSNRFTGNFTIMSLSVDYSFIPERTERALLFSISSMNGKRQIADFILMYKLSQIMFPLAQQNSLTGR